MFLAPLGAAEIRFLPAPSEAGFLARLLVNENPFPGERGYRSEAETRTGMEAVLLVLDARLRRIPPGYRQVEIAATSTRDLMDVITAGGIRGQVDGFYRDEEGELSVVPRVEERLQHLLQIANTGAPGRFARLLGHAEALAQAYLAYLRTPEDPFARLRWIGSEPVTGSAYSWMTDTGRYHPGGRFVAIPPEDQGVVGGNHYFTLLRLRETENDSR